MISNLFGRLFDGLNWFGEWLPQLFLRLILAFEFGEAGLTKLRGENWFENIKGDFPYPFSAVPTEYSWMLATWSEILGAAALVFGLFTRFASLSLIILTIVAALAVHFPENFGSLGELWQGYRVSSSEFGNFKLPLLFLIMLMPLLFSGPGKLSLDHLIKKITNR